MKNAKLICSMMANRIYLGTLKKGSTGIMNDSKIDFTSQAIVAVAEHMMENAKRGKEAIVFEGVGRLVWESLPKAPESTEQLGEAEADKEINRKEPNPCTNKTNLTASLTVCCLS